MPDPNLPSDYAGWTANTIGETILSGALYSLGQVLSAPQGSSGPGDGGEVSSCIMLHSFSRNEGIQSIVQ